MIAMMTIKKLLNAFSALLKKKEQGDGFLPAFKSNCRGTRELKPTELEIQKLTTACVSPTPYKFQSGRLPIRVEKNMLMTERVRARLQQVRQFQAKIQASGSTPAIPQ